MLKIPIFKIRNAWVAGSSPASGLIEKTLCPQGFSFFAFFECSLALSGDETELINTRWYGKF